MNRKKSNTILVKIIECPRDAMQGLHEFIPTQAKVDYIQELLKVGYNTIDFGSFVSPKVIPQMKDTAEVLSKLDLSNTSSKLLAIIANARGAEDAIKFDEITYLGFPFSVSETFQKRNTNSTIEQSLITVDTIRNLCKKSNKELVIYISMGFGNPYGDSWDAGIVSHWVEKLVKMGIKIIALSDTVGVSNPQNISLLFKNLIPGFPEVEFGAHLHTHPALWEEKLTAAYENGCRRFDSAIKGFGGCPMAKDELIGNMATENIISFFRNKRVNLNIDPKAFENSMRHALTLFPVAAN
jgi:hydroxymethylglutaryl-CoA lyase